MTFDAKALRQRFEALSQRERGMVFFAVAALILGATYALALDPAIGQAKSLSVSIADHEAQIKVAQSAQHDLLEKLRQDVNAHIRQQLANTEEDLQAIDSRLKGLQRTLIPAQSMANVMSGILARDGSVRLISLRNIPAEPLILDGKAAPSANDSAAPDGKNTKKEHLYKHGIELVVEGGYFDLLGYLSSLEKQPWRMLWAETSLSADYPKARLRMKLYTLSLDPSWLSV
jgi:MSHA biogenesis protein MshJ